jgi:hypothetical protein
VGSRHYTAAEKAVLRAIAEDRSVKSQVCLYCGDKVMSRNLCNKHYYAQHVKFGRTPYRMPEPLDPHVKPQPEHCIFENCNKSISARGLCHGHYTKWYIFQVKATGGPIRAQKKLRKPKQVRKPAQRVIPNPLPSESLDDYLRRVVNG